MYTIPPKKVIILNILDILNKYTNEEHRMSQKDIQEKLRSEYSMSVERKAIKRNLMDLIDFGCEIEYDETPRRTLNKKTGEYEENNLLSNFYIHHDFEDYEVKQLIDSLVFSNHIPKKHRDDLIKKLEKLSTVYFKNSTKNLEVINSVTTQNQEWFNNIDLINQAINDCNKIHFTYNDYDIDKKLHPRRAKTVNPYKIVAANNHYYLICNEEPFDNLSPHRIDKITDLTVLEKEHFTPNRSLNLKEYVSSHMYMFSGEPSRIKMKVDKGIIGNVIDYFGDEFKITNNDKETVDITLKSNQDDIFYWALQFGNCVEIIEPQELRDRIRDTVERMSRTYLHSKEDRYQKALKTAEKRGVLDLSRVDLRDKTIDAKSIPVRGVTLQLNMSCDYSFVGDFPNLQFLRIYGRVDDFSFLKKCKKLTHIRFIHTGINDLSVIQDLPIRSLCLREEDIPNIDIIYELKDLKELRLSRNLAEALELEHLKEINPDVTVHLLHESEEVVTGLDKYKNYRIGE